MNNICGCNGHTLPGSPSVKSKSEFNIHLTVLLSKLRFQQIHLLPTYTISTLIYYEKRFTICLSDKIDITILNINLLTY